MSQETATAHILPDLSDAGAIISRPDSQYGEALRHTERSPDLERHARLKTRLLEGLDRKEFTLRSLGREIKLQDRRPYTGYFGETDPTQDRIKRWSEDPLWAREESRYGEKSPAGMLEDALEKRFEELDAEWQSSKIFTPPRVLTSVVEKGLEAIHTARQLIKPVIFSAPSGSGKTSAIEEYLARTRAAEGVNCPVWRVTLKSPNPKALLFEMVEAITGERITNGPEFMLQNKIRDATEGKGGVLIVDESQQIGDAIMGPPMVNELRSYPDTGHFGVCLMDSGEVYRRLLAGKHAQLWNRMKTWRYEVPGIIEDDVDRVMEAWGVAGVDERRYSLAIAMGPGQLRELCDVYLSCNLRFGKISHATMEKIRPPQIDDWRPEKRRKP